ncbi:hypothetical protein DFH07DRAFT_839960 [Mycena maculata]|uniref:Ricin B lectin domain-containing protein n=1 Tax=Mycena maculata TaxID=230809 RepID=A0AAD7IDK7_9AGAR|nr:hypothetical protein DFH07DRAFT_839960 [Mycena maculata]
MVNITTLAAAAGFMLVDFQGNVLDSSFARSVENNPVISNPINAQPTANQMWSLVPSLTSVGTFNIQSQLGSTFLSYSGAPDGPTEFAQTTIHASLPANFVVQQVSDTSFIFFEAVSNTTLTSWPIQLSASLISPPVTYEVFHGAPQQFWSVSLA